MKKYFSILLFTFFSLSLSSGQTNNLSFGLARSYHYETQLRNNDYGFIDNQIIKGTSQFSATGLHFENRINNNWGINLDFIYVNRQYEMKILFDACYFTSPDGFCQLVPHHTTSFGYKNIEIPIGVSNYFLKIKKTEFYINANVITSFNFESYYNEGSRKYFLYGSNLFSGSLRIDMGIERNIGEFVKIKMAPFIRIICLQRDDFILKYTKEPYTYFDNFGISLFVLVNS